MRRTKAGWRASDFKRLYAGFGFDEVDTGGDTKYRHPTYAQLVAYVSRSSGELSKAYAEDAVKIIDTLKQLVEKAKDDEHEHDGPP
ncbi:MAG: hypothetical protein IH851_13080 [Armatimonadetes bacterium]|nr:hypothetical protein [Armatimonadota bacterium]